MKYTKKFLIVFSSFLFSYSINAAAQQKVSNYNLSKFKYRTEGYRALSFAGDFDNLIRNGKANDTLKQNALGLGINASARYIQSKSTDAKQRITLISGTLNPATISSQNQNNAKTSSSQSFANFAWHDLNRLYKQKYFIEFGTDASFNGNLAKQKNNGSVTKNNSFLLNAEGSLGIGKGRLEHVSDAQTALFILQDLHEAGKTNTVSPELVEKFGQYITSLRNGRVFDLRKRTKFQLKQIDAFLRDNKIITATNADEISIINDNLFFSFNNDFSALPNAIHKGDQGGYSEIYFADPVNPGQYLPINQFYLFNSFSDLTNYPDYLSEFFVHTLQPTNEQTMRLSGQKIFARVRGVYSKSNTNSVKGVVAQAGFEKQKPINLHWQENFTANINFFTATNSQRVGLRFFQDRFTEILATTGSYPKATALYMNGQYARRYYPNGRTSIEGAATLNVGYSNATGDGIYTSAETLKGIGGTFNASVLSTYFVNNNTVVKASAGLNLQANNFKSVSASTARDIQFNLGFSIIHTFF